MTRWSVLALISSLATACGAGQAGRATTPAAAVHTAPNGDETAAATDTAAATPAPHPHHEAVVSGPAAIGAPAPDFSLPSLSGGTVSLSQFKGKAVVLEWFNPKCPFVRYASTKGPLPAQTKRLRNKGVVWLAINSNAPGRQGYGRAANEAAKRAYGIDYPILLDPAGKVGRAYGAKSTPDMFVIAPNGVLVYRGALDNAPLGHVKDGGDVFNYVDAALTAVAAGRAVAVSDTQSYGCSVKYSR